MTEKNHKQVPENALYIKRRKPFKTFEYSQSDFEKAINEIIKICEGGII